VTKKTLVLTGSILALVVITILAFTVRDQIKRTRTRDTFGKVFVALSAVPHPTLTEAMIVAEVKNRFPALAVGDGKLLDDWEHPIQMSIEKAGRQI
jgi:hypothetical protein